MKSYIIAGLLLLLIGCSKAPIPNSVEIKTALQVTAVDATGARLDGSQLYLNGELAGTTPYRQEEITPGIITLRVMRQGYRMYQEQVAIRSGQVHDVQAVLQPLGSGNGELLVTVNQDSAIIRIVDSNNRVVAQQMKREAAFVLPAGAYFATAECDGFKRTSKAAHITAGQTTIVNLELYSLNDLPNLSFSIVEDTVRIGQAFQLHWQSDGYQVVIDQGVGVRGPNGSEKVACNAPGWKVYTATAYNKDNFTVSKRDSIYVLAHNAPSLTFNVLPDSVEFGESVAIEWQSDGKHVIIDHGVGLRGPSGRDEISFKNPGHKLITATAYGDGNLRTIARDSVYVKPAPLPKLPVLLLTATRKVTVDSAATISWASQNADYVVVDYVGQVGASGSSKVRFATPGLRIVNATAYNKAGSVSARDTIEVVTPQVDERIDDIVVPAHAIVVANGGNAGYEVRNAATFTIRKTGTYRIVAEVWYNSGDDQRNESYYLQVRHESGATAGPLDANAGVYRVVVDDPGAPHMASRDSGHFRLAAGTNTIELYHYAKIAKSYPQFVNDRMNGPESVHVLGFKVIYAGD